MKHLTRLIMIEQTMKPRSLLYITYLNVRNKLTYDVCISIYLYSPPVAHFGESSRRRTHNVEIISLALLPIELCGLANITYDNSHRPAISG